MQYQLKLGQEAFVVRDGAFAGRDYDRDVCYDERDVPSAERNRFEKVVTTLPKSDTRVETKTNNSGKKGGEAK